MKKFICDRPQCKAEFPYPIEEIEVVHRYESKKFDLCTECRVNLDKEIRQTILKFLGLDD